MVGRKNAQWFDHESNQKSTGNDGLLDQKQYRRSKLAAKTKPSLQLSANKVFLNSHNDTADKLLPGKLSVKFNISVRGVPDLSENDRVGIRGNQSTLSWEKKPDAEFHRYRLDCKT